MDKVAAYLAGKLAIGKIDCTVEKELCSKYQVRGFPTLKVYRDGEIFDYPGKRDADSIIDFAEKMSKPAVKLISSVLELEGEEQVSHDYLFMAYDPKAKLVEPKEQSVNGEELTPGEKYLLSSTALQVYGQVARKLQSSASFVLLSPQVHGMIDLTSYGLDIKKQRGYLLAKIEKDTDPLIYNGELTSPDFLDWVKQNNAALVTELTSQNFRTLSQMGKPTVIGVYDPDDPKTSSLKKEIKKVANNMKEWRDSYRFAVMDGKKWSNFLSQFDVKSTALPQYLVLNITSRMFHQNENVTDIIEFLKGVSDGSIPSRKQEVKPNQGGIVEQLVTTMGKYGPIFLGVLFIILAVGIWISFREDPEDLAKSKPTLRTTAKYSNVPRTKSIKED